jgi:RNA polymerase sigma-70 factor (ECF subfamily)
MDDETPDDGRLICEYLKGNSLALAQLWLRYDRLVYGLAHSIVCSRERAEDIRQEVFLKVYARLPDLREPAKFANWLRSITYNTCKSWLRHQKFMDAFELSLAAGPSDDSFEPDLILRERRTLLRRMIDRLPENCRTVVELHYFEEQPVAEIARFLDLPETTIKWRLHRARAMLQRTARINGYLEKES